jgi:Proteasome subunit
MTSYQNSVRSTQYGRNAFVQRDPLFAANTEGHVYAPSMSVPTMNNNDDDDDIIDHTNHGVTSLVPKEHGFYPYDMNGGTVAAIAGPNYCIIASDTRCSSNYEILSRNVSHIHTFSNHNVVLASSGCKTDIDQLRSVLDIRCKVCILLYLCS